MLPEFHTQIILSDSLLKKGVPLAPLGLMSQVIPVLLGLQKSLNITETHCLPGLTPSASLPGWSVFSRPNSSSSSISSPSITSETDFPSFCNWIATVLFGTTLSSTVSQIQSQLPHKAILCSRSEATWIQRLTDNQVTQQHVLCRARACGTHFHLPPIIPEILFPSFLQGMC